MTLDLPPLGGQLGEAIADFRVEEIPAYLPSGDGEHRYVRIEKHGLSTPQMVSMLARAADVPEREIGTAGLKDKHGITTQWVSLPKRSREASTWQLPDNVRVLEESYHGNKLRTGHLHGNRFVLRIVDTVADAEARLPALTARLRAGVLNAFAEQRFGYDGQNIGAAFEWLKAPERLRGPKARFLSKLYPSVIQSELFNRYLSARHAANLAQLLTGEVVRLSGSGSNFIVEDLATEQARFERGELEPQGPMFGPKMRSATAAAAELEASVISDAGVTLEQLEQLSRHAPGTRRDVMLRLSDLQVTLEDPSSGTDPASHADGNPRDAQRDATASAAAERRAVRLSFSLPAGSYATHVVRELTHGPWFPPRRERQAPAESTTDEPGTATDA
jgi:tRNA pseudouridine13 synthase